MNNYLIIALVCVVVGFGAGWKTNGWRYEASRSIAEQAASEAMTAVAKEVAKIDVKNVTIKQKLETVIKERTVYADCQHTDDGLRVLNEALKRPTSNK